MINDTRGQKYLKIGAVVALFLGIAVYGYIESRSLLYGVDISVSNIVDGQTVTDPLIQLSGNALHAKVLTINGVDVPIESDGHFSHELLVQPGYTIIEVRAVDKFDNVTVKQYKVFSDEPQIPIDEPVVVPPETSTPDATVQDETNILEEGQSL